MNSFDVFDTLIARRYLTSHPIWEELERQFGVANFAAARRGADTGTRSFAEIYGALVAQGVISGPQSEQMARREIELELNAVIPVRRNLDRVNHGDVLISDTYLNAGVILQLVRKAGLKKQVTIYQSNGDKRDGKVWRQLTNKPRLHLGDNHGSDYLQPTQAGIKAEWFNPGTQATDIESAMFAHGLANVGVLSREIRLGEIARFEQEEFFTLACNYNLPLLFVLAEMIHRSHGRRNLVFLGRDFQSLHRLYVAYYGIACYLPFSRQVAFGQPADAAVYLFSQSPDNPLFVDLISTGATWAALKVDVDILVALFSDTERYTTTQPQPPAGFKFLAAFSQIGKRNNFMEVMNCGDHGRLERIEVHGGRLVQAFYAEPELPPAMVDAVQSPIIRAVELATIYQNDIRAELSKVPDARLIEWFAQLSGYLCSRTHLFPRLADYAIKDREYTARFKPKA